MKENFTSLCSKNYFVRRRDENDRSKSRKSIGKIDIASVETVIKLPLILSAYIEKYKEVELTLSTGVTAELKEKVLNYQLDGAFVTKSNMTTDPNLSEIEVFKEKLVLITD